VDEASSNYGDGLINAASDTQTQSAHLLRNHWKVRSMQLQCGLKKVFAPNNYDLLTSAICP